MKRIGKIFLFSIIYLLAFFVLHVPALYFLSYFLSNNPPMWVIIITQSIFFVVDGIFYYLILSNLLKKLKVSTRNDAFQVSFFFFMLFFLELSVLNLLVTLYQGLTDFSSIVRSFVSINYLVPVIISTLAALKVKKK